jgi:hypothetical protein
MSPTPTIASTGLVNWLNQGGATVAENAVGTSIKALSAGGVANVVGLYKPAPAPPYKITTLIAATRTGSDYSAVGIGWYDGSAKLHLFGNYLLGGGSSLVIQKRNDPHSNASNDASASNSPSQPIWLQIEDDGINVSFNYSQDGVNFLTLFSTAKSSGFLGATGYSNVVFWLNPYYGPLIGTLMSWTQS